jgi:uncharacterized RDD family membrane protein YckC
MEELPPHELEELWQELEVAYDTQEASAQEHLQWAYAYARREEFQDALQACDLTIQLDPDCHEAYNLRGMILAQQGRKKEAVGAFREALRLKPDFQPARTNLQEIEAVAAPEIDASLETQGKRFGIRAGAYVIDAIAFFVLTGIATFAVALSVTVVLSLAGREFYFEESSRCLDLLAGLVLSALYFASFEWLYGASLGKLLLGMRVVMESGEPCTPGAALIRAGLRYVDGLFFGIPAYATMKAPLYQRIGDKKARTIVVDSRDPVVRQWRAGWWFLLAATLYLALDSILSLLLLAPSVRLGGATVHPEVPTPIPAATFPPVSPTPPPPVPEAMRQPGPGWTSYLTAGELADTEATGLAIASDGSVWFSTLTGAVYRFDGEAWTPYTEDDGLASHIVLSVDEGPAQPGGTGDVLYFATAEGVCQFDGETWTAYPETADLAGGPGMTAVAPAPPGDTSGALWYGTAKGASRFDGESWTTYTTVDGLAANYVLDITVSPAPAGSALWFATNGGVSRFDGQTWTTYTTADGLAHDRVASIAVAPAPPGDAQAVIWFATQGGASRFDGQTWTTYTTADGLAHDDVRAVAVAPAPPGGTSDVLWFGTEGGVSRFDGETWTTYTMADGLAADSIVAIAVDAEGTVWFGTDDGVTRYQPAR